MTRPCAVTVEYTTHSYLSLVCFLEPYGACALQHGLWAWQRLTDLAKTACNRKRLVLSVRTMLAHVKELPCPELGALYSTKKLSMLSWFSQLKSYCVMYSTVAKTIAELCFHQLKVSDNYQALPNCSLCCHPCLNSTKLTGVLRG